MKANHPKTAQEMFDDLAGVEEGGSIYTLRRSEPFSVEYIERISRSSKTDSNESKNSTRVYLSSKRGKKYRMVVDCTDGRCAMEHSPNDDWETYSDDLSGFRYRSPNHPEQGKNWKYE
ncbi:hypothetical protein [Halostagnicola kamekurae]|uniref:hypothetical protein n=1 Tax=Halostagnicola kamekurae TaxID=619731 RepID=UPI001587F68F|nr:hypothetical protein [Halostagnicola kamekurae]